MKRSVLQSGFTLVELMVVVAIVAIMAAGIAPAITTALAEGRAANAAVDLVRLGARGRSETTFTGLAHLLEYRRNEADALGQVRLLRGVNNRCGSQAWGGATLVDSVLLRTYNTAVPRTHVIDIQTADNLEIDICYQPDGAMFVRKLGDLTFSAPNNSVEFTITRVNGDVHGVPRRVVFPYGGSARLER
jgi:prepilin-type N-terminal cleavage/methylation domain-containing protein